MASKPETYVEHWSREGFVGDGCHVVRPRHVPDYLEVDGSHAPQRLGMFDIVPADRQDAEALPLPILAARSGLQISVSGRQQPMPFVFSNVEADEIHFVQQGEVRFLTGYGNLIGSPGDFILIPRAVPYSLRPLQCPSLTVIVEIPGAVKFDPSPSFTPKTEPAIFESGDAYDVETIWWVKSFDGLTRYKKPYNVLAALENSGGTSPVWKTNLKDIPTNEAGHPTQFASSPNRDALLYNLSSRHRRRPPIHYNADYDEIILYFAGPGAWGGVKEAGTVTWVPKGVPHHGPPEDVPEGYQAWMLESRSTLRLTQAGQKIAELMETDMYGPHPSNRSKVR